MASEAFVQMLREMAFLAEMKGENPFKVRALQNVADLLEEDSRSLAMLVASGEIGKIAGVGKGSQALAKEFVQTGSTGEYEELKKLFPPTIFELRKVPGLGPKKSKALFEQLSIGSLAELEYACQENRLVDLKGFGEKTQTNILKSIARLKGYKGKVILPMALQESALVQAQLAALPGVEAVSETGELRRRCEVIGSLDFVLQGNGKIPASLEAAGYALAPDHSYQASSENGLKVRAWISPASAFGSTLLTTTGPAAYVENLGPLPASPSEEKIFQAKQLDFLPPECRDLGHAPTGLVEVDDIRGVFHLHTKWSDGKNTLEEMVQAALERNLEYLGVSEHSQTAFYAHGLNEARVLEQRREIDALQEKYPSLRIFQGIESDILADGSLDFPQEFLAHFDFVIASVHGQMKMSRDDMTKRLCRALENPATTWLGHWSGRLLLGREAYDFDQEAVLATAAKCGKSIELNANPYRLDIDWRLLPRAQALGIPIGIFPDAHSAEGLDDVKYGLWMARKAGLRREDVVNTKTRQEMEAWLENR